VEFAVVEAKDERKEVGLSTDILKFARSIWASSACNLSCIAVCPVKEHVAKRLEHQQPRPKVELVEGTSVEAIHNAASNQSLWRDVASAPIPVQCTLVGACGR
jgi:hypothetical protein